MTCPARLNRLRTALQESGVDGLLVTGATNRRYLSGFTGSSGYLLIDSRGGQWLATDFRYWEQARLEAPNFELLRLATKPLATLAQHCREREWKSLGFEAAHCTYEFVERLKAEAFPPLQPTSGFVEGLRIQKDEVEIELIRESAALVDRVWEEVLTIIRPGLTERELALAIEFRLRSAGASGLSFPTIVASGPRGALAHAEPTERQLVAGEMVTVDMGAVWQGYCSDLTRTVAIGRAGKDCRQVWDIVREAQQAALQGMQPGMTCREADALARDVISKAGYGDLFGHGLGHGVGLDVHEEPRLGPGTDPDLVLQEGMVVTVEPGIYRPGWGGVRLEDLVVVREDGVEVLSNALKSFNL
ncbi:MAG TPA: aminopeptidase P family protein [Firmicutes bacterium]|nr:aminopeptidase P family protein [Bacillota bacterium]